MSEEPDDLDAILAPIAATPAPALRDAIFLRTEGVLRRRRLVQQLTKVGTLAAVLLVGIGIGWKVRPEPRNIILKDHLLREPEVIVVPIVVPVPVPESEPTSPPLVARTEPATAEQAELLAEQADDRGEAAQLYRLAGDKYLNDVQDYSNAARCYRLFLARAGDPALSPEAADTWLLTSLKNAAFKEKFDVAKTDG